MHTLIKKCIYMNICIDLKTQDFINTYVCIEYIENYIYAFEYLANHCLSPAAS